MKKIDPISTAIITMVIGFFFSLVACESKPRKAQVEPLRAHQVATQNQYSNKDLNQLDQEFTTTVDQQWNEVLGAKIGFVDAAQDLEAVELIRQANQYKFLLTTQSAGACFFESFKDSNKNSEKWMRGNGKNKDCSKLQVQSYKENNRYFFKMKGFAGFGIPIRGILVEQEYSVSDIYGYSVQSEEINNNKGEVFASHLLHKAPIVFRAAKVYFPTELQQNTIKGFNVLHPYFSIFSFDELKQMESRNIDWSVPVEINSRGMASSEKNKVTAKSIQLHYYNQNLLSVLDTKAKLWMKINTDSDFNLVLAYETK